MLNIEKFKIDNNRSQLIIDDIIIEEDSAQVDGIGGVVWEGGIILGNVLNSIFKNDSFDHKSTDSISNSLHLVELGCGSGICGIISHHKNNKINVTLSDRAIDLALHNIQINKKDSNLYSASWNQEEADAAMQIALFNMTILFEAQNESENIIGNRHYYKNTYKNDYDNDIDDNNDHNKDNIKSNITITNNDSNQTSHHYNINNKFWLFKYLVVKYINKNHHNYYKCKGIIIKVYHDDFTADVKFDDDGDKVLRCKQSDLQTVIPKVLLCTVCLYVFVYMS